ncbi:MAG: sulfite exporter TauE/SafE family protein [bacterium]|nr:sulfite exporter TauE/SafE family protein [bacterium]
MIGILYFILGGLAGMFSGCLGIGGGIILVPVLVFIFGLTQHQAQGTTLALMVPPIGLLAAWTYYKQGYVDLKIAFFVAIGFFLGGLFGAKIAVIIPEPVLKKIFGVLMIFTGIKMFF